MGGVRAGTGTRGNTRRGRAGARADARQPHSSDVAERRRSARRGHIRRRGAPTRLGCTPPEAPARWCVRSSGVMLTRRSAGCGPPGTMPGVIGRWDSACSTTSRSRQSSRSGELGLERVFILDWDVHHGNGDRRRLPPALRRAVREHPRARPLPWHGRDFRTLGRATVVATRSTRRSPTAPTGRSGCQCSSTSSSLSRWSFARSSS